MSNQGKLLWINIFGFILSLHYAVVSYSASTFLAETFKQQNIWVIYTSAALFALLANFSVNRLLRGMNINRLFMYGLLLATINVSTLFFTQTPLYICLQYATFVALYGLLYTMSSIILEEYSRDSSTGSIRGRYNAILSGGYLIAPFISSIFIVSFGLKSIFLISSLISLIALFVYYFNIATIPTIIPQKNFVRSGFRKIFKNPDLRNISFAQFGLTTFYTVIVIYAPFKMTEVGISLVQYLSIILPVALTPFLFMPPLLGHLEDEMKNEKEILIISYIGLILSLVIIAFNESSSVFTWTGILFFSRLCASSVEISTNSYLYKKIEEKDVSIIAIFSSTDYIATLLFTPLFAILLFMTDLKTLFLSVSFFLCFMLVYISKLHDTKNYKAHKQWKDIWKRAKKRTI